MIQKRYFPIYLLLYLLAIVLIFFVISSSTNGYTLEFIILWLGYIYAVTIFMLTTSSKNMDIFEPIVMMTFVYVSMFLVSPMLSIINGTTEVLGVDVFSACIPGTLISLMAYSAYYYGYYKTNSSCFDYSDQKTVSVKHNGQWTFLCVCGWLVCFCVTLAVVMASGKSLSYILSLGKSGEIINSEYATTPLGFLSLLEFAMIGFWLYTCVYSRNSILKLSLAILSVIVYMAMGSRHVVIEMFFAYAMLHYTLKRKRPSVFIIIICIILVLAFSVVLGAMRSSFQQGLAYDLEGTINFENIYYVVFTSNFDIYKVYYAIIQAIPSVMPFTMGEYMWDSIVKLIPRILWPGKPAAVDTAYARVVMRSISEFATKGAAMAMPNLGAYYMEFGVLGCIIYPYLGGRFYAKVKRWYQENDYSIDLLISACILCGVQFQTLIRGSNLIAMLTTGVINLLPVFLMVLCKKILQR